MGWLARLRQGRRTRASAADLALRTAWFDGYASREAVVAPADGGPFTCPCCGHPTLPQRGGYDICEECDWEDDGQDDAAADQVWGGPNGALSLTAAREAYLRGGGSPQPHRPPAVD